MNVPMSLMQTPNYYHKLYTTKQYTFSILYLKETQTHIISLHYRDRREFVHFLKYFLKCKPVSRKYKKFRVQGLSRNHILKFLGINHLIVVLRPYMGRNNFSKNGTW